MLTPLMLAAPLLLAKPPLDPPAGLESIRTGEAPCDTLIARYEDGDEGVGTTLVSVHRGWAKVTRTDPGQEPRIFRRKLPRRFCQRFLSNVLDNGLHRTRAKRKAGLEDETRPRITVGVRGGERFRVAVWGFEVQDHPAFAIARADLLWIARRTSRLDVLY